jgi:hypothetical protein
MRVQLNLLMRVVVRARLDRLGHGLGEHFHIVAVFCDREAVATPVTRPSLTFRNPARRYWWALLTAVAAIALVNVLYEPSLYRVLSGLFAVGALGALAYRASALALTASGGELVIRNFWRTYTVAAGDVQGLDSGRPSVGKGQTIRVMTALEPIPIDVFSHSLHVTCGTRERLNRRRQELADWLRDCEQAITGHELRDQHPPR